MIFCRCFFFFLSLPQNDGLSGSGLEDLEDSRARVERDLDL